MKNLKFAALAAVIALMPIGADANPQWTAGRGRRILFRIRPRRRRHARARRSRVIPQDVGIVELRKVGEAHLDDHPDRERALDWNAAVVPIEAFTKQWPCVQARAE
jgi:hypothetical protein